MYCSQCGVAVADSARFCRACGTPTSAGAADEGPLRQEPPPLPPRAATRAASTAAVTVPAAGYASFLRRVAASLLDTLILVLLSAAAGAVVDAFWADMTSTGPSQDEFTGAFYLLSLAVSWLYFALMHSGPHQATWGKRALGIKVTDEVGQRIGFAQATGRYVAYVLVSTFTFGIGLVMAAFTRRRQALHDIMAGTLVVTRGATPEAVASGLPTPKTGALAAVSVVALALLPAVGILAAIAIPAYNDYLIRAQVAEGLMAATPFKVAVAEAYANGMDFEDIDDDSLGLQPLRSQYAEGFVTQGVIILVFSEEADRSLQGKHLALVAGADDSGAVVWVCGRAPAPPDVELAVTNYLRSTTVAAKHLPSSCRE